MILIDQAQARDHLADDAASVTGSGCAETLRADLSMAT